DVHPAAPPYVDLRVVRVGLWPRGRRDVPAVHPRPPAVPTGRAVVTPADDAPPGLTLRRAAAGSGNIADPGDGVRPPGAVFGYRVTWIQTWLWWIPPATIARMTTVKMITA